MEDIAGWAATVEPAFLKKVEKAAPQMVKGLQDRIRYFADVNQKSKSPLVQMWSEEAGKLADSNLGAAVLYHKAAGMRAAAIKAGNTSMAEGAEMMALRARAVARGAKPWQVQAITSVTMKDLVKGTQVSGMAKGAAPGIEGLLAGLPKANQGGLGGVVDDAFSALAGLAKALPK